eukprot:1230449-Rhodomonas_salina.3
MCQHSVAFQNALCDARLGYGAHAGVARCRLLTWGCCMVPGGPDEAQQCATGTCPRARCGATARVSDVANCGTRANKVITGRRSTRKSRRSSTRRSRCVRPEPKGASLSLALRLVPEPVFRVPCSGRSLSNAEGLAVGAGADVDDHDPAAAAAEGVVGSQARPLRLKWLNLLPDATFIFTLFVIVLPICIVFLVRAKVLFQHTSPRSRTASACDRSPALDHHTHHATTVHKKKSKPRARQLACVVHTDK